MPAMIMAVHLGLGIWLLGYLVKFCHSLRRYAAYLFLVQDVFPELLNGVITFINGLTIGNWGFDSCKWSYSPVYSW